MHLACRFLFDDDFTTDLINYGCNEWVSSCILINEARYMHIQYYKQRRYCYSKYTGLLYTTIYLWFPNLVLYNIEIFTHKQRSAVFVGVITYLPLRLICLRFFCLDLCIKWRRWRMKRSGLCNCPPLRSLQSKYRLLLTTNNTYGLDYLPWTCFRAGRNDGHYHFRLCLSPSAFLFRRVLEDR